MLVFPVKFADRMQHVFGGERPRAFTVSTVNFK